MCAPDRRAGSGTIQVAISRRGRIIPCSMIQPATPPTMMSASVIWLASPISRLQLDRGCRTPPASWTPPSASRGMHHACSARCTGAATLPAWPAAQHRECAEIEQSGSRDQPSLVCRDDAPNGGPAKQDGGNRNVTGTGQGCQHGQQQLSSAPATARFVAHRPHPLAH